MATSSASGSSGDVTRGLRCCARWMIAVILSAALAGGCSLRPKAAPPQPDGAAKIKFRLDDIRPDGLRGPADGLVAVAYEFCVPADPAIYAEVRRMDPSVQISPGSSGRVGCSAGEALCIGSTHQLDWRRRVEALAALRYVREIRECFFE